MELEEFRKLERQIIQDAGGSVRASVQSLSQLVGTDAAHGQRQLMPSGASISLQRPQMHHQDRSPQQHFTPAQDLNPHACAVSGSFRDDFSQHEQQQQSSPMASAASLDMIGPGMEVLQAPFAATHAARSTGNPFAEPEESPQASSMLYADTHSVNIYNGQQHSPAWHHAWPEDRQPSEQAMQPSQYDVSKTEHAWDQAIASCAAQPEQSPQTQANP